MRLEYKGSVCTCASRKRRESTHAPDVRLCTQKSTHTSERCIYDYGWPPTHFWFISQVDLTPKSELKLSGGLIKDLKVPLFTLKTGWIMPQIFSIKRGHVCTIFSRVYLYCHVASILLQGTSFLLRSY
jgi:hypothetical protein